MWSGRAAWQHGEWLRQSVACRWDGQPGLQHLLPAGGQLRPALLPDQRHVVRPWRTRPASILRGIASRPCGHHGSGAASLRQRGPAHARAVDRRRDMTLLRPGASLRRGRQRCPAVPGAKLRVPRRRQDLRRRRSSRAASPEPCRAATRSSTGAQPVDQQPARRRHAGLRHDRQRAQRRSAVRPRRGRDGRRRQLLPGHGQRADRRRSRQGRARQRRRASTALRSWARLTGPEHAQASIAERHVHLYAAAPILHGTFTFAATAATLPGRGMRHRHHRRLHGARLARARAGRLRRYSSRATSPTRYADRPRRACWQQRHEPVWIAAHAALASGGTCAASTLNPDGRSSPRARAPAPRRARFTYSAVNSQYTLRRAPRR